MVLTYSEISDIIESNFNCKNKSLIIPVMIDYVPVVKLSFKPMFLCIMYNYGTLSFGYTYYRKRNKFSDKSLPIDELNRELYDKTYVKRMGLTDEEIPEELLSTKDSREIERVEIVCDDNAWKLKILNFITTEHRSMVGICNNFYRIEQTPSLADKIATYLIDSQTVVDSFLYFNPFTSLLTSYSKLDNTVISGFSIEGSSLLRKACISSQNVIIEYIDNFTIDLPDLGRTQMSVPISSRSSVSGDNETLGIARITNIHSKDSAILTPSVIRYNVVGLACLADDFGVGNISGMARYPDCSNVFMDILLVNHKLYGDLIKDNRYSIYNRRFSVVKTNEGINFYSYDENGKLSLKQIMEEFL